MGIFGFNTYLKREHSDCMESFNLLNTKLVIDGNMLLRYLYTISSCNGCFGGDYDIYSMKIREFFQNLKKCNIEPFVTLDGIGGTNKWSTLNCRARGKLRKAMGWNLQREKNRNYNVTSEKIFPLMVQSVFKEVLVDENVKFVQCRSEADDIIVSLAEKYKCPVLSEDSDFFIFDVDIISTYSLGFELKAMGNGKVGLPCKKFNRQKFFDQFPGLNLDLLYLGTIILGNDYVNTEKFRKFRSQTFKVSDITDQIKNCLKWLGQQGSVERAKKTIVSTVETITQAEIIQAIDENMNRYLIQPVNQLPEYQALLVPFLEEVKSSSDNYSNIEKEIRDMVESLPPWFQSNYFKGKYAAYFLDLLVVQKNLCPIHIEVEQLPSVFDSVLDILKVIYGILWSEMKNKEKKTYFKYIARERSYLVEKVLNCSEIVEYPWLPTLRKIKNLSVEEKKKVVTSCLSISDTLEKGVPKEWTLYIFAVDYWSRKSSSKVSKETYRYTLLLLPFFNIIDKKIGYYRAMEDLDRDNEQDSGAAEQAQPEKSCNTDIGAICDSVTKRDCWYVAKKLLPYFQMPDSEHLNVQIIHYFNEFQMCFSHILNLNALLDYPYVNPKVSELLNGTLFYNLSQNVQVFVKEELRGAPKFVYLLESLKSKLHIFTSIDEIQNDWNSNIQRENYNYFWTPSTSYRRPRDRDSISFWRSS